MFSKKSLYITLKLFCLLRYFFSLGKEQGKICNNLGGEIEQFKPVGSFFIESTWLKKKRFRKNSRYRCFGNWFECSLAIFTNY